MKSLRQQFEEDYKAVLVSGSNGKKEKVRYIYDGPWYMWDLPERELKQKKILLAILSTVSLALFLVTGSQNCVVNQTTLVAVMGTFALAVHVLELFRVFEFLTAKYRTERMIWDRVNRTLRLIPLIRGISLAGTAGASIITMSQQPFQVILICVTAGYLACAVMALIIFLEYLKIPLRTEKNTTNIEKEKG